VLTAALEIHDAGLILVRSSDPAAAGVPASPGYALFDGDRLLTGVEAAGRSRREPRQTHTSFWDGLSTDALGPPFPPRVSAADLAHGHLSQVWERAGDGVDEVLLAVPGFHDEDRLGLILGIARACGMPVAGMVDSAVAAAVHGWPGGRLLHLDLHLHRAVVTELVQTDRVLRGRVETDEQSGLAAIRGSLLRRVAQLFLHETRFDPLHAAATEQRLWDALPHWLARLHVEEVLAVELESAGEERVVELTLSGLGTAVDEHYDRIVRLVGTLKPAGETTTVLLAHHAAMLPGLEARLAEVTHTRVVALGETAVPAGALVCRDVIRSTSDELPFVIRLPLRPGSLPGGPPPVTEPPTATEATGRTDLATHVVLNGVAHAIGVEPLILGVAVPEGARGLQLDPSLAGVSRVHCSICRRGTEVVLEDHSSHGSFVNGERVVGELALVPGDRVRLGSPGVELQLIRVAENDATSRR
jgi:hypothetical protein